MKNTSYGFLGGGRVVRIMLEAMKRQKAYPARIVVSDAKAEVTAALKAAYPDAPLVLADSREAARQDLVFLAIHPPAMMSVLDEIKSAISKDTLVISLTPKFKIATLSAQLGGHGKIVRIIPNAPSFMNAGYNPVTCAPGLSAVECDQIFALLDILGKYIKVEESKLEGYAMITAMGPTYLWFQLFELHKLGISFGLNEQELQRGIKAMTEGTLSLLYDAGMPYEQVVDLIPVKPIGEAEEQIRKIYNEKLCALFDKIK